MEMTMTSQTAPSARFWDRIAKSYARKPVGDETAYQRKLAITQEYLRPDMELLELGCGTGSTALVHAPFVQRIHATDISENMLEIAREKAAAQGVRNVDFERASVEDFNAADGTYDMVLALSLLHLLEDEQAAIAKVHRLLKPDGLFVTSTVCLGGRMWWLRLIAPLGRALGQMPLVRFFTEEDLVEKLRAGGFEIERRWRPEKSIGVFIVARKAG